MPRLTAALTAAAVFTPLASAGTNVTYTVDGTEYEGYLAEATRESKGLVIIIHDWDGLDDYERTRAEMLADQGYDAFAIDIYGKGNRPQEPEKKMTEVRKLYSDRPTMRARILASLNVGRAQSGETDAVIMGYCFGGGATLDLARSGEGENISGFATFHGGLTTPEGQTYDATEAPILILHGGADAGIPNSDAATLADELEAANVPYQLEIYSGAPHAWTVFGSDRYRELADTQSWSAFSDFIDMYLGSEG
ncbi:MAG: dienelactone hydrolase family protein [Pseudomonadota bacterium]